eukprot:UN00603
MVMLLQVIRKTALLEKKVIFWCKIFFMIFHIIFKSKFFAFFNKS